MGHTAWEIKVTPDEKKEKKELAELDKRIGTLADLISQTSAPDALLRKIEQFETECEQIIRVLAEIEDEAKNKKILNQLTENDVRKMLKTVLEEIMNEDPEALRDSIHQIVEEIILDPNTFEANLTYKIQHVSGVKLASPRGFNDSTPKNTTSSAGAGLKRRT